MKIGVFSILFNDQSLDTCLDMFVTKGIEAVELGCGGYSLSNHCDAPLLLSDPKSLAQYRNAFDSRGLVISALSAHGNPIHPDKAYAARHHAQFEDAVRLASELNVDTVLLLSGCPGGSPGDATPNWVTCTWPEDFARIHQYQWEEVLIPYWKKAVEFARPYGVTKLAIEPHPGFCVYNTETMLKLRSAVGPEIGINFDPSHLFWQGIDPSEAILALGDCIFHVHAKDTELNPRNIRVNGVIETKGYDRLVDRSWLFRTVGYGQSLEVWRAMMSAFAKVGYDHVLSIEHEDALMSREEGFSKAVEFLKQVVIAERPQVKWWELRAEG